MLRGYIYFQASYIDIQCLFILKQYAICNNEIRANCWLTPARTNVALCFIVIFPARDNKIKIIIN
jgi:hypothetical protein